MNWYGPCERAVYYSQRNNLVDAARQCLATSLITAIAGSGWQLPDTSGRQPEDDLCRFAASDARVTGYQLAQQPWSVRLGWPPYTEHDTLAYAAGLWLGRPGAVAFSRSRSLNAVVADLVGGRCSVVTGRFTPGGHAVAIVGVETSQWLRPGLRAEDVNIAGVLRFMAHDPWGDWHTGYVDHNGRACLYTPDELARLLLQEGRCEKWIHFLGTTE